MAGFADGAGQIAGGVEFELRAEFGAEALSQSVQQAGGAQHETVLQAGGGVLAQNGGRSRCRKVDLGQLGGLLDQRCLRQLRAGQDDAAHKLLLLVHGHDGDGCVGGDNGQRAGRLGQRGNGAAQKLCTQLGRIVQPQLDAALQARPNGQKAGGAKHPQRRQDAARQRGHDTAQNASLDALGLDAVQREQIQQIHGIFVNSRCCVGVQTPAELQGVVFVSGDGDVCVADVDRQDHGRGPPLPL